MKCRRCKALAQVSLPSHNTAFCADCFDLYFIRQVETAIRRHRMFPPGARVLVALSGGKDSLALMWVLSHLGYAVTGLHVDLGIPESSPQARARVEAFCADHGLALEVLETARHGLAIPDVYHALRRPICPVCGKVKRYYFNKTALQGGYAALATGHNLDKPLCRLTEFETAAFCFLKDIPHVKAPCPYSKGASFTGHKSLWADLEERSPGSKIAFYDGFLERGRPAFAALEEEHGVTLTPCRECGYPTSADLCGVCRLKRQVAGLPPLEAGAGE
jgi:uncharacterized protein (TIGR00269 family)